MSDIQIVKTQDTTANPGPLGLTGFALATLTLGFHNAGIFPSSLTVVAMAIFVGGLAQLLAGMMEWKKGNTFGMVAFTGFGVFWLSFAWIQIHPFFMTAGLESVGLYLALWGLFGLCLLLGTLKMKSKSMVVIFALLVLTFFVTAFDHMAFPLGAVPGICALLLGLSALYKAMADVLNEQGYNIPT
ncbi:Succinate-acetate/proton symporter SatP [Methanosarcinaceae archaeon Ag5]|uniref:Succinate-acetate/proton symporter SatP n=1 Tax=Methanolapillus africanus TaxID=3028297 RepID=A0AAE4ML71_9EURY|nr:Succinate-acetate/proton symporter SatP [Methanosarcinaceae archaeon Ag5]